jgi:small subunit ribosomal protein S2
MAEEKEQPSEPEQKMLVPEETYMTSGVHIGTRQKTSDIKDFIYKVRNDGLYIIDVKKTDDRIKAAAHFLSKYDPNNVLAVSVRQYGQKPIQKMSKHAGIRILDGRFRPGTLTNPKSKDFFEPDVIILTDPLADIQALHEAKNIGIPVVALCDTNNETRYIDIAIPTNNKGRRALALIYWLMTREILRAKGQLGADDEFSIPMEDFEAEI